MRDDRPGHRRFGTPAKVPGSLGLEGEGGSGLQAMPRFLGIPGENSVYVYSANEYLTRANLMKAFSFAFL